jgi:hypothetical protein
MIFNKITSKESFEYLSQLLEVGKMVEIKPIKEHKTLSQNAYIWLVFTHIGFETGAGKDAIYNYYLTRFPKYNEIDFKGKITIVRISLSQMSKEQVSKFIDEVVIDGIQEGFDIPDPANKKAIDMYNYYRSIGEI